MAKVQIKSEKITPFGGIFHVRELFSRFVAPIIDKVLGIRITEGRFFCYTLNKSPLVTFNRLAFRLIRLLFPLHCS